MQSTALAHLPNEVRRRIYRWIGLPGILPLLHASRTFYYDTNASVHLLLDFYGPEHALYDLAPRNVVGHPILRLSSAVALLGREDILQDLLRIMFTKGLATNAFVQTTIRIFAECQRPSTPRESRLYGIVCGSKLAGPALDRDAHVAYGRYVHVMSKRMKVQLLPIPMWHQRVITAVAVWGKKADDVELAISTMRSCGNILCLRPLYQRVIHDAYTRLLHPSQDILRYQSFIQDGSTCEDLARLLDATPPTTTTWETRATSSLLLAMEVEQMCTDSKTIWSSYDGHKTLFALLSEVTTTVLAKFWVHIWFDYVDDYDYHRISILKFMQKAREPSPSNAVRLCIDAFRTVPLARWHDHALFNVRMFVAVTQLMDLIHPALNVRVDWLRYPAGREFVDRICNELIENVDLSIAEVYLPYRRINKKVAEARETSLDFLLSSTHSIFDIRTHVHFVKEASLRASESDKEYLRFSGLAMVQFALNGTSFADRAREMGSSRFEVKELHSSISDMLISICKC